MFSDVYKLETEVQSVFLPPEASVRPRVHRRQPAAPHSHQAVHQSQQTNQQLGWRHGGGWRKENRQDDQAVADQ